MRVIVSVPGRFHGFDLARELAAAGEDVRLVTTYPHFATRRFVSVPTASAPWLELARRAAQRLGRDPDGWLAPNFARFTARRLGQGDDILVGWSNFTLETIAPAHAYGLKVVLERGSSHILHQDRVLRAAGAPAVPAAAITREQREYELADAIMVPTGFARDTFLAHGVDGAKVHVNPYGVALRAFTPSASPPANVRPRALFVGRVGRRKGIPDLLEAARRLGPDIELVLIGPVEAGMDAMLAASGAVVRGPLPGAALPAEYRAADMFVLPSLEEGLPLVILQAMASGLPVIATPETGIGDLLGPDGEALVVPSGNPARLAEAMAALAEDPARRLAMGAAARRRVENGYSWADYCARAQALYRLIARGNSAGMAAPMAL